jgi:hypothetical protein
MVKLVASGALLAALGITASLAISAPLTPPASPGDRINAAFAMIDGAALRRWRLKA